MEPSRESRESEWDAANLFEKWTFSVANPLLSLGQKQTLEFEDMMTAPKSIATATIFDDLHKNYAEAKPILFVPKLMCAMNSSTKPSIIINSITSLMEGALRIASPVVLGQLLAALIDKSVPLWYTFVLAIILGSMSFLQTFIHGVSFYFAYIMGVTWKTSTIALVFNKLFHVKSEAFANGTGKLVNLISNDVSRFEVWGVFMVFFWETYLEIIAIFVILVYTLTVLPVLAGVGTALILIPLQLSLAKQFAKQRTNTAQETDSRVRHTSEVIEGITSVKSFGWEKSFTELIALFRSKETGFIAKSQSLRVVNQGIYYCSATIATFATFSVFWAQGNTITIPIVFLTLSMLQALKASMNRSWAMAIENGSEAAASCDRIDNFLSLPDSVTTDAYTTEPMEALVEIKNSAFCYGDATSEPVLRDVDIEVKPGELVIIVGKVGAGKSTYLNALLGEMAISASCAEDLSSSHGRRIKESTRIAYCHQRPWILASSVRENIIFAGHNGSDEVVDEEMYRLAVESCCIVQDMQVWPAYDNTEIGERGVSVSGGQKARIGLARAVYSDADLYILDDPLSAVDAMVSKALFFDCIIGALKNRNKGIVLATHQLQYLQYADRIIVLDKFGKQVFSGDHSQLQERSLEFLGTASSSTKSFRRRMLDGETPEDEAMEKVSSKDLLQMLEEAPKYDPAMRIAKEKETREQEARRQIIQKEDRVQGNTALLLYWKYVKAGGLLRGFVALGMAIVSQVILMICDYWIRWWASSAFGSQTDIMYLWVFAILTGATIILGFVRAQMWFDFTLKVQSSTLAMLSALIGLL